MFILDVVLRICITKNDFSRICLQQEKKEKYFFIKTSYFITLKCICIIEKKNLTGRPSSLDLDREECEVTPSPELLMLSSSSLLSPLSSSSSISLIRFV